MACPPRRRRSRPIMPDDAGACARAAGGGMVGLPLVGREGELATLLGRLADAGRGQGGVALVAGEPGIGKTRLLAELADRAGAAGWTVLVGHAYDTEGMPPYLPFIEALRSAFAAV